MNSATVLLLAVTTAFLLTRLRRLQGRTTYAHAFVPLLLLNPDHYSNTVWPIQIGLVLPACLMCCAIVIQAQGGRAMAKFFALGPLALLICMCGANGLPLALGISPMLLWIGVQDYRGGARRRGAALLLFAVAIYVYTSAYFIHLERNTLPVRPWKLDEALLESVIAVSMSLGSCAQYFWPYATIGIVALLIACSVLLLWHIVRRPEDRLSATGLLLFLCGSVGLAVGIGFGRTILGPGAAWAPRYATFVAPILFAVFVVYSRFGSVAVQRFVQMTLLVSLSLGFTLNGVRSIAEIDAQMADGNVLEREVAQHVPIARLAAEHGGRWMFTPDLFAENMRLMMNAGTGIYKRYPPGLNGDVLWLLSEGTELQGPSTSGQLFRLENYGMRAGTGLIAYPPHRASVFLNGPARYLHVGYGILHDASVVQFRVSLRTLDGGWNLLWSRTLDPVAVPSDRGIQETNIEMPQGVKRGWRIVFETVTRPGKGDHGSWPFWTAVTVR